MRLKYNQTTRGKCYYIIRSIYKNGKNTSETVEKLGYPEEIKEAYGCKDPYAWMQERLDQLNEAEKAEKKTKVLIPFDPNALITKDQTQCYNTGYLFLQQIYYQLRLDLICSHISKRHGYQYDMNAILSRLIYSRILFPGSKLSTWKVSKDFLEPGGFEYHQVVRALSVLAKELVVPRKTQVLYYDCTNFYFETEEEDEISNEDADRDDVAARKYGFSKQHQPSPLVQMGMFMDYSGIPLAICINRGNKNENQTLIPLEEKLLQDFELSKFVVCTDAGLCSEDNRMFNNFGERSFITTVSIKKMKEQCLDPAGWHVEGETGTYDIRHLEDSADDRERNYAKTFYKEIYLEDYDEQRDIMFNQTLIVTYSLKYRDYLRHRRDGQIQRLTGTLQNSKRKMRMIIDVLSARKLPTRKEKM